MVVLARYLLCTQPGEDVGLLIVEHREETVAVVRLEHRLVIVPNEVRGGGRGDGSGGGRRAAAHRRASSEPVTTWNALFWPVWSMSCAAAATMSARVSVRGEARGA